VGGNYGRESRMKEIKVLIKEGIWWVDFIYLHEIEQRNLCNYFKWSGERVKGERLQGDLINV
jgi:hypothetical protein